MKIIDIVQTSSPRNFCPQLRKSPPAGLIGENDILIQSWQPCSTSHSFVSRLSLARRRIVLSHFSLTSSLPVTSLPHRSAAQLPALGSSHFLHFPSFRLRAFLFFIPNSSFSRRIFYPAIESSQWATPTELCINCARPATRRNRLQQITLSVVI